jgi:hypothetical protein
VSAGLKVRQPLARVALRDELYDTDEGTLLSQVIDEVLLDTIRDELNVKAVEFDKDLDTLTQLDTTITPELKQEGDFREFVRQVQTMRKQAGCEPRDRIRLSLAMNDETEQMVKQYFAELEDIAGVTEVDFVDSLDSETLKANDVEFKAEIAVLE